MTRKQIRLLKELNKKEQTAVELCHKLRIVSKTLTDSPASYYNELNKAIQYDFESDCEISELIDLPRGNRVDVDHDYYCIKEKGKLWLKEYNQSMKRKQRITLMVALSIILIVFVICYYN